MANQAWPNGEQDLVGNYMTCSDLFNVSTKSFPAALGTGLAAAGAYVPGSVTFSATAVSNVYQVPYAETLILLVSLTSGTASSFSINTGATATSCVAAANTGTITDTTLHTCMVVMPSAALGTSQPGAPTAPYVSVSANIPAGAQINLIALLTLGYVPQGAGAFIRGGGINAIASAVINTNDTLNPPTNLVGSGAFNPTSFQ